MKMKLEKLLLINKFMEREQNKNKKNNIVFIGGTYE